MNEPIAIADLTHRQAPRSHVTAAVAFMAIFAAISVFAAFFGADRGRPIPAFIPICATLWGLGDLLTAFLLFTQFRVNGNRAFAILGAAYAIPGILTIGYIAYFPNIFLTAPFTSAVLQVSVWLWVIWHVAFALFVGVYHLIDPHLTYRIRDGEDVGRLLAIALTAVILGSVGIVALIVVFQARLPLIVVNGSFTRLYGAVIAPIVLVTSIGAAIIVLSRSPRPRTLQLWLAVALVSAGLDGALNAFSTGRYTISWYVGKVETLITASVVLMILLSEVNVLYRRLGTLATVDGLTGLANRQSFDADARWTLALRERVPSAFAFLVVDIDFFKQYNDLYGHQAGDACLRAIAQSLQRTCARTTDLVARYGGEEFVVFLPGATSDGAGRVAENIRAAVESLGIVHAASRVAPAVTVSVGVCASAAGEQPSLETLFQRADAALYAAKRTRNTVATADAASGPEPAALSVG